MKKWHAMIDIETLGTTNKSTILSIGAVKFDPMSGKFHGEQFYSGLDIASQKRAIDADTLMWWLGQDRVVFDNMCSGTELLDIALSRLRSYLSDTEVIWANGVMFDIGILEDAYKQNQQSIPWKFWQISCMRTLKNLVEISKPKNKKLHDSLADAKWQAEWVIQALKELMKNGQ